MPISMKILFEKLWYEIYPNSVNIPLKTDHFTLTKFKPNIVFIDSNFCKNIPFFTAQEISCNFI